MCFGRLLCSFERFFFVKLKTAYEMRISDWSSDVCSSDLGPLAFADIEHETDQRVDRTVRLAHHMHHVADPHVATVTGQRTVIGLMVHACLQIGRASCRERVCQYV